MSEHTITFVAASVETVQLRCKGWRRALPEARTQMVDNPFTGQKMPLTSWDPDPTAAFPDDAVDVPTWNGLSTLAVHMVSPEDVRDIAGVLLPEPERQAAVRVGFVGPDPASVEHREILVLSREFATTLASAHGDVAKTTALSEEAVTLLRSLSPFARAANNRTHTIFAYFEWG